MGCDLCECVVLPGLVDNSSQPLCSPEVPEPAGSQTVAATLHSHTVIVNGCYESAGMLGLKVAS